MPIMDNRVKKRIAQLITVLRNGFTVQNNDDNDNINNKNNNNSNNICNNNNKHI